MSEQYGMGLHLHIISRKQAKALGMKYYFTGKPCKRGGFGERSVYGGNCRCRDCLSWVAEYKTRYLEENREEILEKKRKHRQENREKIAHKQVRWYQENREKVADWGRRYRKENQDAVAEYKARYLEENREKVAEYNRRYRQENREAILENNRQHYQENKHIYRASNSRRRSARRHRVLVDGCELTQLVEREAYGLARERLEQTGLEWHVDHMLPMQSDEASGFHHWSNLQVIPAALNLSKNNRMIYTEPFEWLKDA